MASAYFVDRATYTFGDLEWVDKILHHNQTLTSDTEMQSLGSPSPSQSAI